MQSFEFYNPTRIIFGDGKVSRVGVEAAAIGKKALLVYGRSSIKTNGIYDQVTASLNEAGVECVDFGGVKSNPVLTHAVAGVELARSAAVDLILAVGGGSVLDEAKAIAAGILYDGQLWDLFAGDAEVKAALPVMTVLTLAATGSEMNGISVLTNEAIEVKFRIMSPLIYPRCSILDPELTFSVSPAYTAYSGVDAASHLMELYFTHREPWAPVQERYAEGLLKTIFESTRKILADPEHKAGRGEMMWAATLAWNGLMKVGLGPVSLPNHMLGLSLGALYDLPHGATLSIVLPAWMEYYSQKTPDRLAQFARNVFDVTVDDSHEAALAGVAAFRDFCDEIGSPTSLAAAGVNASEINRIVDNVIGRTAQWGLPDYSRDVIGDIFRRCAQ